MEIILMAKIICLFVCLYFWPLNIVRSIRGQKIGITGLLCASASLTGLITLLFWV